MSSLCPVSVFCGCAWGELSSVQRCRTEAPLGAGAPTDSKYPALNQSTPEVCNLWILGKDLTKPSIQPFFELCLVSSFSYSFSSAHPLLCVSSVSPHLSSPFPCSVFFPVAFPPLMFTYLGLGLSRSPCQAASSCRTKSVLPESMAPLSHSQEVQIQWGTLSIATRRRISRVARRLQQLKFKCVQFCCLFGWFFSLICSEFMLNSLSMAFPILPLPFYPPFSCAHAWQFLYSLCLACDF